MTSLVSEFLIQPVLRQARRFSEVSFSRSAVDAPEDETSHPHQIDAVTDDHSCADNASVCTPTASHESPPRPLTPSTEETRVDNTMPTTPTSLVAPRDPLNLTLTPLTLTPLSPRRRNTLIPEDDGMAELRSRIQAIHAQELSSSEKAKLMHNLLLEGYKASKAAILIAADSSELASSPINPILPEHTPHGPLDSFKFWNQFGDSPAPDFILSESDKAPCYAPVKRHGTKSSGFNTPRASDTALNNAFTPLTGIQAHLGCRHYERNVKLQCFLCNKWYPCRLCHDAEQDHKVPRFETRYMLCMLCTTPQRVSDICINCGELAAQYYCSVCKLWEDRPSKPIYHCNDCGICRRGLGLGKDYVHCKTCCVCIPTSMETSHKCIERSTDCDCPICGEYLFTSPRPVVFMPCGHSIHKKCYDQHMRVSYKCPICNKSLANMETQFRNLDAAIQSQPMPPEFRDTKAVVLCNDCSGRCTVPYHWLGQKCSICRSYNTVELQILGGVQPVVSESTAQNTISQPIPVRSESEQVIPMPSRRRHSARGINLQRRASEIIAGSFPPINMRFESNMSQIASDSDSDDGMLGGFWGEEGTSFWGGSGEQGHASSFWGGREERASLAGFWNGVEERASLAGFWGGGGGEEGASFWGTAEDEEEEDDSGEESTAELEEEDENEIVLFGHR